MFERMHLFRKRQETVHALKNQYVLEFHSIQFTFSAMLNRDRAYQSILDQGMILGLPWGSDPIGDGQMELGDNDDKEGDDDHEGRDGSQETGENA